MNWQKNARSVALGLVGGIGAGKSFATREFVRQGALAFNADQEAKKTYERADVVERLREWRPDVIDDSGRVVLAKLAELVFEPSEQGAQALARLNAILRDPIAERFQRWRDEVAAQSHARVLVLDAPLLFEAGWDAFVDYVVYVDASETTRKRRARERGWAEDELEKRERAQTPIAEKKARADFIIDADRDESNMSEQVASVLRAIALIQENDAIAK